MAASGALAFDGRGWPWEWPLRWSGLLNPKLFTIVTKTLTRYPRRGNLRWFHPWSVVKKIKGDGWVNAIGLTNPGIDCWVEKVAPRIPDDYQMIVSIEANEAQDVDEMIGMLNRQEILGIELNLSCPNTASANNRTLDKTLAVCEVAAQKSRHPVIAKISYTHDYLALAQKLQGLGKIEAISINSIPWNILYPDQTSPLARFGGGGISGKKIQPWTWKMVQEISQIPKIPVIGPSVWDYEDIDRIFRLGAKAVSFGSIFISYPWRPTSFVRRWQEKTPG